MSLRRPHVPAKVRDEVPAGTHMATYAFGDIQGCLTPLHKLLDLIQFDPASDRLWFTGDLVNRGPHSLDVLRLLKGLDSRCVIVLGNHDLHVLAVHGSVTPLRKQDTLHAVLDAPDSGELMDWLRRRPLLHREGAYLLVHAGILPQWHVDQAMALAGEVERALRSDEYRTLLPFIYRPEASRWDDTMPPQARLGFVANVLTRMRMCSPDGLLDLTFKGPPEQARDGLLPWFRIPPRRPRRETVLFGHWSALGVRVGERCIALDGGCVWGNTLACLRLEDRTLYTVACGP